MSDVRICHSCQSANQPNAESCAACGAPLLEGVEMAEPEVVTRMPEAAEDVAQCPACLTRNPAERSFCWRCLTELRTTDLLQDPAPTPRAELAASVVAAPLAWAADASGSPDEASAADPTADVPTPPTAGPLVTGAPVTSIDPMLESAGTASPVAPIPVPPTPSVVSAASRRGGGNIGWGRGIAAVVAAAIGLAGAVWLLGGGGGDEPPITAQLPSPTPSAPAVMAETLHGAGDGDPRSGGHRRSRGDPFAITDSHACSYPIADCHSVAEPHAVADANTEPHTVSDPHTNANAEAITQPDADSQPNAITDPYPYPIADAYPYPNADSHAVAQPDTGSHAVAQPDADSHAVAQPDSHADPIAYADTDSHVDAIAQPDADPHAIADPHADSYPIA